MAQPPRALQSSSTSTRATPPSQQRVDCQQQPVTTGESNASQPPCAAAAAAPASVDCSPAAIAGIQNHALPPKSRESATPPLVDSTPTPTPTHLHNGYGDDGHHLQQHLGGAVTNGVNGVAATYSSAAPSTTMSHPPQPPGPPRQQPVGYPSPTSYHPQPGMNPPQYGYAPVTQGADMYRQPPSLPPNPALSLPSMRSIDPLQQQQQQQQQVGIPMQAPMPPGAPMGYYTMPYPMGPGMSQYALPMSDPRVALSGGRHKKEIKRRTKTGCLTCRKRRIKCDETHPTCNNCKKSKRECAGYDPIFKQQNQSSSSLQLAPSGQSSSSPTTVASASTGQAASGPFGTQPHVVPSSFPTTSQPTAAFDPSHSTSPSSGKSAEGLEPFQAIDPTLESVASKSAEHDLSRSDIKAKKMKVDELIALGGPAPPAPTTQPTRETLDELTRIYYDVYVPGLGSFFETSWYNFKPQGSNSLSILLNNKPVMDLLLSFLTSVVGIKSTDPSKMASTGVIEGRVVWALASLVYTMPAAINVPSDDTIPSENATEARNRLAVFETLLSGGSLTSNPCFPPPKNGGSPRVREFEFWWWMAEFLRLQDTPQTNLGSQRDEALSHLRNLLDGRENRDVLYSLAILRELSPKFPPGYESDLPQHHEETDPRTKLAVAAQFIRGEAQTTGGSTNVVRRFAELALKAFINPGVNIARRT